MSDLEAQAVHNNAAWCDTVCRLHGLDVHLDDTLWWTSDRSPDFYPDVVTLVPGVPADEVLTRVDASAGCSVKDSFADLDLQPAGFRILFEAHWIARAAEHSVDPAAVGLPWRPVREETDLLTWVTGHGEADALLPTVLAEPHLQLLLAENGGARAGLALNRSTTAVGVSNLFADGVDPARVWDDVAGLAGRTWPGLPVVGYEGGADLALAERAGFTRVGPLRIWLR